MKRGLMRNIVLRIKPHFMTTRAKNWIIRPYLDSAHWIEEESTILVTDTFCVLTSVTNRCSRLSKEVPGNKGDRDVLAHMITIAPRYKYQLFI